MIYLKPDKPRKRTLVIGVRFAQPGLGRYAESSTCNRKVGCAYVGAMQCFSLEMSMARQSRDEMEARGMTIEKLEAEV